MSYATFSKIRPFWILKPSYRERDTCLCKQHTNISLMVNSLKSHKIINESTINEVIKNLCCGDYPQEKCLERLCSLCKNRDVHINAFDDDGMISYQLWTLKKEEVVVKGLKKMCAKTVKESRTCSKVQLVDLLRSSLKKFMQHVCNINHQYTVLDSIRKNLSHREVMIHMDFSENYVLKYASEVQSSHFGASKKQISLHTSVVYYGDMMKPHSYGTFSNCLRHDPAAICAHLMPVLKEVQEFVPNLETVHFVSDGPSTQYRNKTMFNLAGSYLASLMGLKKLFWHYSEAGHGKGAPDGIGGCLKRTADSIVAHGRDLPNLDILVNELKAACKGINVLAISDESISEMDNYVPNNISPFKGTLSTHQIVWCSDHPSKVFPRRLSCLKCLTSCEHYGLGEFKVKHVTVVSDSTSAVPETLTSNNSRLRYEDVYCSSDDDDPDDHVSLSTIKAGLKPNFEEGMFILVKLSGKKITRHYVAQILTIDEGGEFTIKFMKKTRNKSFSFPEKEDVSVVDEQDVKMVLDEPQYCLKRDEYIFPNDLASFSNLF